MYDPCRMSLNANLHALVCAASFPSRSSRGPARAWYPGGRILDSPRSCAMTKTVRAALTAMAVLFGAFAVGVGAEEAAGPRDATEATRQVHAAVLRDLPF